MDIKLADSFQAIVEELQALMRDELGVEAVNADEVVAAAIMAQWDEMRRMRDERQRWEESQQA